MWWEPCWNEGKGSTCWHTCELQDPWRSIWKPHLLQMWFVYLHTHSWNLGCDFRGKVSLGRFCKTLSCWIKGPIQRWLLFDVELKQKMRWEICLATAVHFSNCYWQASERSPRQCLSDSESGLCICFIRAPESCSQCKWNQSSFSGLQEELEACI